MALAFIQNLCLLPQTCRSFAQIIRAAEVNGNLFPEVFAHIHHIAAMKAKLLR
ncbi:hypothetical protein D3C75_512230 [compost metagenome]